MPVVVTRTGWTSEVGYEVYTTDTSRGQRGLRGDHGGGRGVQHQADRPERHPPHRGRHLQLGRRHDLREQRRSRWGSTGWSTSTRSTDDACISARRADRKIRDAGVGRKIVRRRDRRRAVPGAEQREVGRHGRRRRRSARSRRRSTRRAWSKNIGYCWLPTEYEPRWAPSLSVATEWGDRNAAVVEMPFVDPKKQIPVS